MCTSSKKMSTGRHLLNVLSNCKIELYLLLFTLGVKIPEIPLENLMIYKLCRQENFNVTVCENLLTNETFYTEKEFVQKSLSDWKIYLDIVLALPMIFIGILIGPWSDNFGRKLPLLIPAFGRLFSNIFIFVNILHIDAPVVFYLLSFLPAGIAGRQTAAMIAYSYMTDIVAQSNRMVRFSILVFIVNLAETLSNLLGTKILENLGYLPVIYVSTGLYLAAILFALIKLDETVVNKASIKVKIAAFFRLRSFKECFQTLLAKRTGRRRFYMWLLLSIDLIFTFYLVAEWKVLYMFTQLVFNWGAKQYSIFTTVQKASSILVLSIVIPAISKFYKVSDNDFTLQGIISCILGYLMFGLCRSPKVFYFGAIIGEFHTFINVGVKAAISKLVMKNEQGKLFALILSSEVVFPLAANVFQLKLYKNTLTFNPGLIYIVNAAIMVIPLIIILWMRKHSVKKFESSSSQTDGLLEIKL